MTKRELVNRRRFEVAATQHWRRAVLGKSPGPVLYAALNAAVGKLTVAQADKARKAFLQALRRRAR